MKYIWIIMLAVVVLLWIISSVLDIIDTVQTLGIDEYTFNLLDDSTQIFVVLSTIGLFAASLTKWLGIW